MADPRLALAGGLIDRNEMRHQLTGELPLVLRFLPSHLTNAEIARECLISVNTVTLSGCGRITPRELD